MNIREDIKLLKLDDRSLRKFGLMVGGVFALLGLIFFFRHKAHWPYFVWPGAALIAIGAILPRALKYIYLVWMSVAFVLGFLMAHVILTLFFFLIVMPIGLIARLSGKDFLGLKVNRAASSYWLPRENKAKSPTDYERQF
jgi:hypothetical protein